MKAATLFFSLLTACSQARILATYNGNYTIVVPQWRVQVSLGGPYVTLNGTVQEVRAELLRLSPNWDNDYQQPDQSNSTVHGASLNAVHISSFVDGNVAGAICNERWLPAQVNDIADGIKYLANFNKKHTEQPTNGPGWGNCGRVSCSYKSAIYWCNDTKKPKTLISFASIADGARYILEKCAGPGSFEVAGQVFHKTGWNVIVRHDEDHC